MRHVPLVAVVYSLNYLSPDHLSLKFGHLPIGLHFQIAMQAAAVHILHNQENLLRRFKSFIELSDVGMIKFLHDFHFSLDALFTVGLDQLNLFVYFDSDLLVQDLV